MSGVATKRTVDFTEGPIFGKMIRFALPIMVTALLQTLYNASDMVVVGQFSPNGACSMGAVGACGSLISLCINFFIGLSSGVGVCVAQSLGAGHKDDARKYTHTSVVISLVCGTALGIFGFLFAKPLLTLKRTFWPEASTSVRPLMDFERVRSSVSDSTCMRKSRLLEMPAGRATVPSS